jgi:carbon-monoxide dehydrogenase small subunit
MSDRHEIELSVNGEPRRIAVEARRSLADALRHDLGLTGTKLGCEHGVCGACTVLADGAPIRSCIVLAVQAQDWDITTVESLPDYAEGGSDLQRAFADNHALQCGFCTPGFLMLASALTPEDGLSPDGVREYLSSNICRCTGYQGLVDAVCQSLAGPEACASGTTSCAGRANQEGSQ